MRETGSYRPPRLNEAELEQMFYKIRKPSRHVHVKRELVLRVEVGVGKVAVHLSVRSRHGEADARQHVVGGDPVNVVLVDLGAYDDAVFVLVLLSLPLACPLLANVFCPSCGIVVLLHVVLRHVRSDRSCGPTHQRH
jgi:hypothetical protein